MKSLWIFLAFGVAFLVMIPWQAVAQSFNPTILQDTRDLPHTDGTFGFLYRTEDGIAHAAKGNSDGVIHGTFSYTDPTGLKVNYNYNAGSRVTPGYQYDPLPGGQFDDGQYDPKKYQNEDPGPRRQPYYQPEEVEPLPPPPPPPPQVKQPRRYHAQYREPVEVYQRRRSRPANSKYNDVFDDSNYY